MVVKIIDEGPDPSVIKQVVCRNCGVKLEYLPVDIQHQNVSDYGGGSETLHYIDCLKCKERITVKGY